jgi:arginase
MRGIHIYKIRSRLGLKNPPAGSHTHNIGVEDGPDAVVSPSFIAKLPAPSYVSSYAFPKPERVSAPLYRATLARHILSCANDLRAKTNGGVPLTVGGDHSIGASSLLSLLTRKNPKDVGYVQFDSHADINSFATSPSGNFHGMWLRPFLETMDDVNIAQVIPTRLPTSHVCFIGNMVLDPGEKEFIHKKRLTHFSQKDIRHNGVVKAHLSSMIRRFKHLHIGFDIDIFHASLVAATGTPNDHGLFPSDVFPLLEIVAQHPSISVDLVEVNPKKKGATKTIRLAQEVLTTLLQRQV